MTSYQNHQRKHYVLPFLLKQYLSYQLLKLDVANKLLPKDCNHAAFPVV